MDMQDRPRIDVDFVNPDAIKTIVNKENYQAQLSLIRDVCDPKKSYKGVTEELIPVDLSKLPNARIMRVEAGTYVPKHAHEGPVFRVITAGEAIVNGTIYKEGDWMIIPDGYAYEIETPTGYTALWVCGKC